MKTTDQGFRGKELTNPKVLRRMGEECKVILTVKQRKLKYLGSIIRNEQQYELLQLIL